MKRTDFLKGLGLVSAGAILPLGNAHASSGQQTLGTCTVMPDETEGPYPYTADGTTKNEYSNPLNRSDVRESQTGIPLTLTFNVVNTVACGVIKDVRVDIWHCDHHGYYSGYGNQTGGADGVLSYIGATWLRGYQTTDANGQVTFTTIYPGWYDGRATHIHIELYVNGVMKKTTQVTFPETISDAVHVTALYAVGSRTINTTRNAVDNVFAGTAADLAAETMSITGDNTNGYAASVTIGLSNVAATGGATTGVATTAAVTGISVYPNPATDKLVLNHPAATTGNAIRVMSLDGRIIASGSLATGATATSIDISSLANGMYLLVVETGSDKQVLKFVKK